MALIARLRPDREPFGRREPDRDRPGPPTTPHARPGAPRIYGPPDSLDALIDELSDRWARGETPRAEEYVARLADPRSDDVATLAYHEYQLAETAGLDPDPDALLDRFPAHRERLDHLLQLHRALDPYLPRILVDLSAEHDGDGDDVEAPAGPELPQAGDEIGVYHLIRELGRGSFARVFLARQADLEDRYVVLKVSTRGSPEPRLLARARHAQIVEVLQRTEARDEGGTLHLLCMPFLGGATLSAVLGERRRWGRPPRNGNELLTDLDHVAAPEFPENGRAGASREILAPLPYPKAVAWLVARLAEALDHAFDRDVTHGDLKPSNILLAADGRPLLFDFNLSVDWRALDGDDLAPSELGGTLAYMAPERLRALADPDAAPLPRPSDRHRADVYALGLILAEALTGRAPEVPGLGALPPRATAAALAAGRSETGPALRSVLRSTPHELRPVLLRCLAPDPAERYARASELAADLDLYRVDLPPRHAGSIGLRHRLARWARRHRLAVAAGVLLLAGAVPAAVLAGVRAQSSIALAVLRTLDTEAEAALAKLDQLWGGATPGVYRYRRNGQRIPTSDLEPARAALDALALYGLDQPGDWRLRDDVAALPEPQRLDLEAWLLEQSWRYADAVASRPDWPSAWRRAAAILARIGGPTPPTPLLTQRARLHDLLDLPPPAKPAAPAPPWLEQYLLGVEDEAARPADAVKHYRASLRARPDAYWSHYRLATAACAPDVRNYALAESQIRRCLAIRPGNPLLHLFRAGLLYYLDKPGASFDECNRALALDPELVEAYRTRLWARIEINKDEAVKVARKPVDADPVSADFRRLGALVDAGDASRSWPVVLDAWSAFGSEAAFGDTGEEGGLAHLEAASLFNLDARWALGWRLTEDDQYRESLARFESILSKDPDHIEARYARARLLDALDQTDRQGLEALVSDPEFENFVTHYHYAIRAFHVLVSEALQAGDVEEALAHARHGLEVAQRLDALPGESHYALARALAVAAGSEPRLLDEAAENLRAAGELLPGGITERIEADPFFADRREEIRARLRRDDEGTSR